MRSKLMLLILIAACGITVREQVPVVGPPGPPGQDGSDGVDGVDGEDGIDATLSDLDIVAIVDPCGPQGTHDEVFLKLRDGTLIASFSASVNGNYTRFSILRPGVNYQTTDGTNCIFSVDAEGNLYGEHN